MVAHGTRFRRLRPLQDVPAVQADPPAFRIRDVQFAALQELRIMGESVSVGLFDSRNALKGIGDFGIALLAGAGAERRINRHSLLKLAVAGHAQEVQNVIAQVHGEISVNMDLSSGDGFHMVVENLRVLLLLIGGERENGVEDVEILLAAERGGERVAVSRLTFPRKGQHEIFQGFALRECRIHGKPPCHGTRNAPRR